jgi:hypothetical protein
VVVPLGVFLAIKMIPAEIMEECRAKAQLHLDEGKPRYKLMGVIIIGIWILALMTGGALLIRVIRR